MWSVHKEKSVVWTDDRPGDDWHPDVAQIFRHWQSLHPQDGLPARKHFDPASVVRLLPGIWLLDVQREPFRLRYRLAGTRIAESIGREVTGQWMDEAHPDVRHHPTYFDRYEAVARLGKPSWRKGRSQLWRAENYAILENILLPLASDGQHVDMILAYTVMHDVELEPELAHVGMGD